MQDRIREILSAHQQMQVRLMQSDDLLATVERVVALCVETFTRGGKLLFCGNGGSAADAQHLAAEFSGRFYLNRRALFAEALHVNTSFLTAVANDYGFDYAFARMVEAAGRPGDVLFAISTSGNSTNILKAVGAGRQAGLRLVGMTGESGGQMGSQVDYLLNVPSDDTPRIQEGHILLGHIICELVEAKLFKD